MQLLKQNSLYYYKVNLSNYHQNNSVLSTYIFQSNISISVYKLKPDCVDKYFLQEIRKISNFQSPK